MKKLTRWFNSLRSSKIRETVLVCGAVACLLRGTTASAQSPATLPTGGQITTGSGAISQSGSAMQINQTSQQLITNWTSSKNISILI